MQQKNQFSASETYIRQEELALGEQNKTLHKTMHVISWLQQIKLHHNKSQISPSLACSHLLLGDSSKFEPFPHNHEMLHYLEQWTQTTKIHSNYIKKYVQDKEVIFLFLTSSSEVTFVFGWASNISTISTPVSVTCRQAS